MHQQMIGAGMHEIVDISLRLDNHQMDVDRFRRRPPHGFDDNRADRQVWHEAAVHDIDVNPVGAGRLDGMHLLGEPPEISRQDRRRDDHAIDRHLRPLRHSSRSAPSGPAVPAG